MRDEGLYLGGSTAINVAGAVAMAREMGPGHTIVTILCDSGQDTSQRSGIRIPPLEIGSGAFLAGERLMADIRRRMAGKSETSGFSSAIICRPRTGGRMTNSRRAHSRCRPFRHRQDC